MPIRTLGVIPVRLTSSRLHQKALQPISGRSLLERVWRSAVCVSGLDRLVVATDSEEVAEEVRRFGGEVVLSDRPYRNGSERCWGVAQGDEADVIINIQGDQPFLRAESVEAVIAAFADPEVEVATPVVALEGSPGPSVVRAVADARGNALYFSRQAIPTGGPALRHVGIYGFRREALERYANLEPGALEVSERLEQLRLLEYGIGIRLVRLAGASSPVDTPEDLERARRRSSLEESDA